MPDFHRLNKTRTTEMSREELNRRLKEEAEKSARKNQRKTASSKSESHAPNKKQQKIAAETKKQLPPQSPARKKREAEVKKRAERERRELEKTKHRRKKGSNVIYYVALSVVALIIFSILSVTVLFNANKIVIEGETSYSDEEIIEASGLKGTENLVSLNTGGIPERILDALVSLDSAVVEKSFPSTIKIKVTPAKPMANFYYNGKNYVISHVGRVMQIESEKADCMEVVGYRPSETVVIGSYITAEDPEQDKLVALVSEAAEEIGLDKITKLDISDTLSLKLTYDGRIAITLGSALQLDQKMKIAYELICNGHIGPSEMVTLDISNIERVVQRPIITTTAYVPQTLELEDEDEVPEEDESASEDTEEGTE